MKLAESRSGWSAWDPLPLSNSPGENGAVVLASPHPVERLRHSGGASRNACAQAILMLLCLSAPLSGSFANDGELRFCSDGTNALVQVRGDRDDDWRLQVSDDLVTWSDVVSFGTLRAGGANPPVRSVGLLESAPRFYRAVQTGGLFDPTLLRTISLTFTQSNWQTQLADGWTYGTNAYCSFLVLDNGTTNEGVGVRYRGYTSYTGVGGGAPIKKSLNIDVDHSITNADLMRYETVNLNNAFTDETIMREPLYFNVMRQYSLCPAASLVQLYVNGANWGVYSLVQQENGDLIKEYCPSSDGDRWRAPNDGNHSAFGYFGNTNLSTYQNYYELKSDYNSDALPRLINAIYVLNNTATNRLRDKVEEVFAVDRWLWFLAIENIFADEDSYWYKGADYSFYYEPESGRIHPVEHDGNETFVARLTSVSPVRGWVLGEERPLLRKLLGIQELRQRFLAHMRTVIQECFNPSYMAAQIDQYVALSVAAISADPKKGYTSMTTYTNDLLALKTFITNRYNYLTNHAELTPAPPVIGAVYGPTSNITAGQTPFVTAEVWAADSTSLDSVWLYHRGKAYGRFTTAQMYDDGTHEDGGAEDGIFGAATTNYPAGTKVRFYVEARAGNTARAASFAPPRAEEETYSYRVALTTAPGTSVVINELMASNSQTVRDPQGEYDDWIELHNISGAEVDLTGHYLSDEPNNPRKWQFPPGTTIPADGLLVVWADEDGSAPLGLHASFKLSASGEELFLTDTDQNLNAVLDSIAFGPQETDRSYGRTSGNADIWAAMAPTPGAANK